MKQSAPRHVGGTVGELFERANRKVSPAIRNVGRSAGAETGLRGAGHRFFRHGEVIRWRRAARADQGVRRKFQNDRPVSSAKNLTHVTREYALCSNGARYPAVLH